MGKTSYEVIKRYKDKVYAKVSVELPKDIVLAFREKCAENGVSQASVIKDAITEYLNK